MSSRCRFDTGIITTSFKRTNLWKATKKTKKQEAPTHLGIANKQCKTEMIKKNNKNLGSWYFSASQRKYCELHHHKRLLAAFRHADGFAIFLFGSITAESLGNKDNSQILVTKYLACKDPHNLFHTHENMRFCAVHQIRPVKTLTVTERFFTCELCAFKKNTIFRAF